MIIYYDVTVQLSNDLTHTQGGTSSGIGVLMIHGTRRLK